MNILSDRPEGLGKHNQGIQIHEELRESGIDIHRPTMELGVAASSFQTMYVCSYLCMS